MKTPGSFLIFCVACSVILITITIAMTMTFQKVHSDYVGMAAVGGFLLSSLLAVIAIIFGLVFKTDNRAKRIQNRIGLFGSVVIILLVIFLFALALQY